MKILDDLRRLHREATQVEADPGALTQSTPLVDGTPGATLPTAANSTEAYEPDGVRFYDAASGRNMVLVADGAPMGGWLHYRHPNGQWVSLRKATDDDRARLGVPRAPTEPAGRRRCGAA